MSHNPEALRMDLMRMADEIRQKHGVRLAAVKWTWVPPQPEYQLGERWHVDEVRTWNG